MTAHHRQAITELVYSYAERVDGGDFEGVGDLFADGEITYEGSDDVVRGRRAVVDRYRATTRVYPETGTPRTKHVTTNLMIEVNEAAGTASARSYFTVLQATPALALQPIIAGRYHDSFVLVDGRWFFRRRHIICDLFGELGEHLLFDLGRR